MSADPTTPPVNPEPRSEADSPRTTFIFLFVLAGAFVLTGLVMGLDQFFSMSVRAEFEKKVLQVESAQLRQLRAEEQARLTRYQWVDSKAGVVRIPVARARELVLAEWKARPDGFQPPAEELAAPAPEKATPSAPGSESK